MLIINADDWGGSREGTDAMVACLNKGRITAASGMVFMEDSERAADLAKMYDFDVGLHVNLTHEFTAKSVKTQLRESQGRIARFLTRNKYAQLLYNPTLRREFRYVFEAQLEEFLKLYGDRPSHFDGHRHMHLCSNMLVDTLIPAGERVRRSFSFWPGEKSLINRAYRFLVDRRLASNYRLTDFFFSLLQCLKYGRLGRVTELARTGKVELMTHPMVAAEREFLLSEEWESTLQDLPAVSHAAW
jgi:chitin disaccharide deacetylase